MSETPALAAFTLVAFLFGTPAGQAPKPHAGVYLYDHGPNNVKFPKNALTGGGGDRWTGAYVLAGPAATGKAGRWELRSPFLERVVYATEGWDGTGSRKFDKVLGDAIADCTISEYPPPKP